MANIEWYEGYNAIPLKPLDYTEEIPLEDREAYSAAEKRLNGWMPSEHLRFIERDGKRILQQLWVVSPHRPGARWIDVPYEKENENDAAS